MINLKQFDLEGLSTLWRASESIPEFRQEIEAELKNYINANKNFSREFIFRICKAQNHALGVNFIPSSEAFNEYGHNITIDMLASKEEMLEMVSNCYSSPPKNTHGRVKATYLPTDGLSPAQIELLATKGFDTRDILSTIHL
jgi:hypothetical protein